jgi:hypothetical protein
MHVFKRIFILIPLTKETRGKIDDFIIELRNRFEGVTWSSISASSSSFEGWGLNLQGEFEQDSVAILFTDINPEAVHVEKFAKELKKRMEKRFAPQQVWMTINEVVVV